MTRVAVLTFHWAPNYGALAQTYALVKILENLCCEVVVVNLTPKKNISICGKLFQFPFNRFRHKYLPISRTQYFSSDELKNAVALKDFDLYIVGSDQVWNKEITRNLMYTYFFDFLDDNKKKISYAASFGNEEWFYDEQETLKIKSLLSKFEDISVRENSAVKLCKDFLNLSVKQVLDPTLLLGNFSEITGRIKENKAIVCFKFIQGDDFYSFLSKLAHLEKRKIYILNRLHLDFAYRNVPFPSIKTWISYIGGASLVVTDSFHGLCMALVHHRQFIVFSSNSKRQTRLLNLLEALGLEERFFSSYNAALDSQVWKKNIDYSLIDKKINLLRKSSLDYIKSVL